MRLSVRRANRATPALIWSAVLVQTTGVPPALWALLSFVQNDGNR